MSLEICVIDTSSNGAFASVLEPNRCIYAHQQDWIGQVSALLLEGRQQWLCAINADVSDAKCALRKLSPEHLSSSVFLFATRSGIQLGEREWRELVSSACDTNSFERVKIVCQPLEDGELIRCVVERLRDQLSGGIDLLSAFAEIRLPGSFGDREVGKLWLANFASGEGGKNLEERRLKQLGGCFSQTVVNLGCQGPVPFMTLNELRFWLRHYDPGTDFRAFIFAHLTQWESLPEDVGKLGPFGDKVCFVTYRGSGGCNADDKKNLEGSFADACMPNQLKVLMSREVERADPILCNRFKELQNAFEQDAGENPPLWTRFGNIDINAPTAMEAFNRLGPLLILIEGYLAVHKPGVVFGDNPSANRILTECDFVGTRREEAERLTMYRSREDQRIFPPSTSERKLPLPNDGSVPSVDYWFQECLPVLTDMSWAELWAELSKVPGLESDGRRLGQLYSYLRASFLDETGEMPIDMQTANQESVTNMLVTAREEIVSIWNALEKDWERKREGKQKAGST